jgi:hypothetical protein
MGQAPIMFAVPVFQGRCKRLSKYRSVCVRPDTVALRLGLSDRDGDEL